MKNKEPHIRAYKFFVTILRPFFKLYYKPTYINKHLIPKEGPLIICGNHVHLMDQCLTITSTKRMIHYMAKKEYFESKFAWFFKLNGCISVDRETSDKKAKEEAINLLKKNYAVGVFPEGTRNKSDKALLDFKFGTVSRQKKLMQH